MCFSFAIKTNAREICNRMNEAINAQEGYLQSVSSGVTMVGK